MLSMAAASLFLPFLPLLAGQILLNNFLSDVRRSAWPDDSVDRELIDKPRGWDIQMIGRFMVVFGCVSALFDFVTFGALRTVFAATPAMFPHRLVRRIPPHRAGGCAGGSYAPPFYRCRPGSLLLWSTMAIVVLAFAIRSCRLRMSFGFVPLPARLIVAIAGITIAYVAATELAKRWFYDRRNEGLSTSAAS